MDRITIIYGDDWNGVYVNQELVDEGHSFDISYLLEQMKGVMIGDVVVEWIPDGDHLDYFGNCLPPTLNEILNYISEKNGSN